MKIAMIGQKGIPTRSGGIERHVGSLTINLAKRQHTVFVYTRPYYTDKELKTYKNVDLISLPTIHTKHLDTAFHTFLASLHAIFFLKSLDIIHYHGIGPALFSWLPRLLKPSLKVVTTFHCRDYYHQKWSKIAQTFLKLGEKCSIYFSHELIVVSKQLQGYVKNTYNRYAEYIPNGIQPDKGSPKLSRALKKSLSWWNLKPQKYIIVVTRLVRHKNVHGLIKAYKLLDPKIQKQRKLVIVGDSTFTDDYKQELKKLAGDNKNIVFTGRQGGKSLEVLFRNACLFVQPSESEGLSLSLLEALNYGLPTLVSNIPANIEVTKGKAFAFKNKSIQDLAEKLAYILSLSEKSLQKKATSLKKEIAEEYSWEKLVKSIELIYQKDFLSKSRIPFRLKEKQI